MKSTVCFLLLSHDMATKTQKKPDNRKRNWAFEVYPESTDTFDMYSVIQGLHVPCAISPLHDKDKWTKEDNLVNPEHIPGELKKPHYHILLMFEGKHTPESVIEMLQPLVVNWVEPVASVRGYTRYLVHKDNPEKAQYKIDDIATFAGFSTSKFFLDSDRSEVLDSCESITKIIKELNICTFCDLVDYFSERKDKTSLDFCIQKCFFIDKYLSSRRQKKYPFND